MCEAGKVVDHLQVRLETGLGSFLQVGLEIVHAADAVEKLEAQPRVVSEKIADSQQIGRLDHDKRVVNVRLFCLDLVSEFQIEKANDVAWFHRERAPLRLAIVAQL